MPLSQIWPGRSYIIVRKACRLPIKRVPHNDPKRFLIVSLHIMMYIYTCIYTYSMHLQHPFFCNPNSLCFRFFSSSSSSFQLEIPFLPIYPRLYIGNYFYFEKIICPQPLAHTDFCVNEERANYIRGPEMSELRHSVCLIIQPFLSAFPPFRRRTRRKSRGLISRRLAASSLIITAGLFSQFQMSSLLLGPLISSLPISALFHFELGLIEHVV